MRRKNSTTQPTPLRLYSAWLCGDALAADPASAADSTLAEVIVTGTRLIVKQSDSTAPVTVLDRRDIDRNGADSAAKVLRVLPMNTGSPNGTNVDTYVYQQPFRLPVRSIAG
jgi:outer membrane cobalamin receptor